MEQFAALATLVVVLALTPLLIWLVRDMKPKRGGVASSVMDGVASVFQTEQVRLQDAKREKKKGGRESGEPPTKGNKGIGQ